MMITPVQMIRVGIVPASSEPGNGGIVPPWLREPFKIVLPVEPVIPDPLEPVLPVLPPCETMA